MPAVGIGFLSVDGEIMRPGFDTVFGIEIVHEIDLADRTVGGKPVSYTHLAAM